MMPEMTNQAVFEKFHGELSSSSGRFPLPVFFYVVIKDVADEPLIGFYRVVLPS
jgi:hypothetical protein